MSGFPYDTIADFQKWTSVSETQDRSKILPQGPPKFRLPIDAKIASAGSCFAKRIAERLPKFGLRYIVSEPGAEPYSARFGNIYTARQLRQLFARAFGRFDPLEQAWKTARGTFVDPFRPFAFAEEFPSAEAVENARPAHLAAVRTMFETVDVFVFTLGLFESWHDRRDGAVFPICPGRGIGEFDLERFAFSSSSVEENVADLDYFLDDFAAINPSARVVFTLSPVPLAATMLPMHVVRASILSKSTLKVAAETVARDRANVDYFASYDLVTANLGNQRLFEADGRHVRASVADRVTEFFVEHYFGVSKRPETGSLPAGAECDEDRLLALLATRSKPEVAPASADGKVLVRRPIPLYFVGDSTSVVFRNALYDVDGFSQSFVGVSFHIRRLLAQDLCDLHGRLNASVLKALIVSEIVSETVEGTYFVNRQYSRALGLADDRFLATPAVMLCCGHLDAAMLHVQFGDRGIDLPPHLRPPVYPAHYDDDVPYDTAYAVIAAILGRFEKGLQILQSYGITNLSVHMLAPAEALQWLLPDRKREYFGQYQALTIVFNEVLRAICERSNVVFVEFSNEILLASGERDPRYSLDAQHLNEEASAIAVRRLVTALRARDAYV